MLMLIYTVAGIIGFIYEEICVYINDGVFFKRGTTYGPWIPIYGFGCLLIYFLTVRFRKKPWLVFLISALSCGSLELATGFVLDKFFHLRLWDYSLVILNWGNLNGYICVRSVTTWGIFALILIYAILPPFEKLQDRHPKVFNIIAVSLFSLFVLDIIPNITYYAREQISGLNNVVSYSLDWVKQVSNTPPIIIVPLSKSDSSKTAQKRKSKIVKND